MDRTQHHEAEVKREHAVNSRTMRMAAEAAEHAREELSMREAALDELKGSFDRRLVEGIASERLRLAQEFHDRDTAIRDREATLREQMVLVKQQQLIHERMVEDLAGARSKADRTQKELAAHHEELGT